MTAPLKLLTISGWALDHRFFASLERAFAPALVTHHAWADVETLDPARAAGHWLVAHSLGAFEVARVFHRWPLCGAILCATAETFTRPPGAPGVGVLPRVLERMEKGLLENKTRVLTEFYENAFAPQRVQPEALPLRPEALPGLAEGLVRLKSTHRQPGPSTPPSFPVYLVHGEGDRIVDLAGARLLAEKRNWPLTVMAGAGHSFPATHGKDFAAILFEKAGR